MPQAWFALGCFCLSFTKAHLGGFNRQTFLGKNRGSFAVEAMGQMEISAPTTHSSISEWNMKCTEDPELTGITPKGIPGTVNYWKHDPCAGHPTKDSQSCYDDWTIGRLNLTWLADLWTSITQPWSSRVFLRWWDVLVPQQVVGLGGWVITYQMCQNCFDPV